MHDTIGKIITNHLGHRQFVDVLDEYCCPNCDLQYTNEGEGLLCPNCGEDHAEDPVSAVELA